MGIRSGIAGLFRWAATSIDPVHPRDPALAKLFGLGASTTSGVQIDEQKVLGYPAVMRGVSIIANAIAKVRPRIYERTGRDDSDKVRAVKHQHYSFVSGRPCREISGFHFRQTMQHYAMLWGNGCAYVYRRGDGSIDPELGMVPLSPDSTELVRIRGGEVSRNVDDGHAGELMYVTRVGGELRKLLPENVFHIHGLGYSGQWGYSVVDLLKETFGLGLAAREFGARFFGQGTVSSGYVTYPEGLDEEGEARWAAEIKSASQGLGRAHRVILLEHGSTFTPATVAPNHAQFLETRQFEVREIANAIGIQPHKLGDPSRKSYASLEQSNQEHMDDDLDPWLVVWEEEYADICLSEREKAEDTHIVEFNRKEFLRTNLAARTAHYVSGMQWGWYSPNDVRRKENETPLGPAGDVRFRPANMVELGGRGPDTRHRGDEGNDPEGAGHPDPRSAPAGHSGGVSRDTVAWQASWGAMCAAILGRMAKRVTKQAEREAASPATFAAWLESLEIDRDTPADCVPAAQRLVGTIRLRLASVALANLSRRSETDGNLQQAVAAIAGELQTELPAAIAAEAAKSVLSE